jgi:adenylate cyclase
VRVTAQLIETARGAHLWADRYDRALDDIFAVQDEVVATIATTLASRIEAVGWEHAKRKPPADTGPTKW